MHKIISILCVTMVFFYSCKKDKADSVATQVHNNLFTEITASGLIYYKNGMLLPGAAPSPHGSFKLRFNAIALAALDSTGELPVGGTFPNGSVLVKDIYTGSSISLYAMMKKDPTNSNAGNGWIWSEYKPGGTVAFSAENNGVGCIGCHSGAPNRDLVRTFDLH